MKKFRETKYIFLSFCSFVSSTWAMDSSDEAPRAHYKSQNAVLPIQLFENDNKVNYNSNNNSISDKDYKLHKNVIKRDQQLLSTAIRIECEYESNLKITATGFIGSFSHNQKVLDFLVTNKHVISKEEQKLKKTTFYLPFYSIGIPYDGYNHSAKTSSIETYKVCLSGDFINVFQYIEGKEDVCSIYLGGLIQEILEDIKINRKKAAEAVFQIINFKTEDALATGPYQRAITPLSESPTLSSQIQMIGYPLGLYDTTNNLPISRIGNLASDPLANYKDKGEYLINIPLYEGSSGSPVFMVKEKNDSKKIFFVGIAYGGPQDNMSKLLNFKFKEMEKRIDGLSKSINSEISERKSHQEIIENQLEDIQEDFRKESSMNSNSTDDDDSEGSADKILKRKADGKVESPKANKRVKKDSDEAANVNSLRQFANLAYVIKPQYIASSMFSVYNKLNELNQLCTFPIEYSLNGQSLKKFAVNASKR